MTHDQVKFDAKTEIDFVIIEAGAAGGIIARELSAAGFRVVVLEQGPYMTEKDFEHDELKYMHQRAITNDYKRQPNTFRKTEKEKAKEQPALIYGRQVGGGTVHFTANYCRLSPFVLRTTSFVWLKTVTSSRRSDRRYQERRS